MAKTKYQKLISAKKKHCEGKSTKSEVNKIAKEYVANAVAVAKKKAPKEKQVAAGTKAKADAEKKANKILRGGCKVKIAGKKKTAKKATAKKTTAKKRSSK